MKIVVALYTFVLLLSDATWTETDAFSFHPHYSRTSTNSRPLSQLEKHFVVLDDKNPRKAFISSNLLSLFVSLTPAITWAATEVELADLPPPWIPVVFGFGLVVGVGLLTGSLGDVIEEESQLGLQSGARAKKEIDRSRSSYFKKK